MVKNLSKILAAQKSGGITFIGKEERTLSYAQLFERASKLGGFLREKGMKKGAKLIFQLSENENFVYAFWASIVNGVIAVPVSIGNNDEHRLKLLNIYALLEDAYLIVDSDILAKLEIFAKKSAQEALFETLKSRTIDIRSIDIDALEFAVSSKLQEEEVALIQFSSGSTGEPKGVMLTHKNIIENAKGFLETAQIDKSDSYLSWFPLTHDMGLMGWHINPLILGVNQVLIQTNTFIRRPTIWLDSATKFGSTILCSPNFGYRYLLKFLKGEQAWDLGAIRLIFNGAEPISASLCDEFLETLAPYGLKKESMYTVYGLAEATLAVAFPKPNTLFNRYNLDINSLSIGDSIKEVESGVTYVDVGYPLTNMQIRISDDEGAILQDDRVGHIEIKSISVTQGYYNNPSATQKALRENGWLDTGDLGFMREGKLIITGRAKDIIIKNGLNYYPHDIEDICCEVEHCELNKVVAIGNRQANQEDEELIIFVLFKKELSAFIPIKEAIEKLIAQKIGLEVQHVIPIKNVHKTTSGKLQRFKLLKEYQEGLFDKSLEEIASYYPQESCDEDIVRLIQTEAKAILGKEIEPTRPFSEEGFSSITLVSLANRLSQKLHQEVDITALFDHPSANALALFLTAQTQSVQSIKAKETKEPIAIISMACRFPDANTPEEFFNNLLEGVDSVKASSRWSKPYMGGFLDEAVLESFDNSLFRISPAEAQSLDPQARLALTCTSELFERGAIDAQTQKDVGIFFGVSSSDSLRLQLGSELSPYTLTSNLASTLSGRLAYFFDFKAPVLSIDTACSSSLVALHQAIASLHNGECSMAVAGGVNVLLDAQGFEALNQMQALSGFGKCQSFDEHADGYVRAEGCGVVLLKPLSQAVKDNNSILAVVESSVLNHDGKSNGLTAPSGVSQQALLQKAYQDSLEVEFIETHGTGTKLGDPIEVNALQAIFKDKKVYLGALKSHIGHLEAAAGIAGVIKSVMAMQEGILPANLHLKQKNSLIAWEKMNLIPLTKNTPWETSQKRLGVSSFGFSGTNAHVVLRSYPKSALSTQSRRHNILIASAKDTKMLEALKQSYLSTISANNLANVVYSASLKPHFSERLAIVGTERFEQKDAITNQAKKHKSIFLFTGQGSQYHGMARELFEDEPLFKAHLLTCEHLFKEMLGCSLLEILYANDSARIDETLYTQTSIFAIEYALASYLIDLGVVPEAVAGHSLGEYVASVIAGVLSLEEAFKLVVVRAKLIEELPSQGAMASFMCSAEKIFNDVNRYHDKLSIASINAQNNTVVAGDKETLEHLMQERSEIRSVKLNVKQAYHSILFEPMLVEFYVEASKIRYKSPKIPFISSMKAKEVVQLDANYFTIHLRNAVQFMSTVEYIAEQNFTLAIEIGAQAHLSALVMHKLEVVPMLRKKRPSNFYEALATLYTKGIDINWALFNKGFGTQIAIPSQPMQFERFPINFIQERNSVQRSPKVHRVDALTKLQEFVYQSTGLKALDVHANLFELGIDSLALFQIRENLKKEFALEIEMRDFYLKLNSLHKLAEFVDEHSETFEEEVQVEPNSTNALVNEQMRAIEELTALFDRQLRALKRESNAEAVDEQMLKNASLKQIITTSDRLSAQQEAFLQEFIANYNQKHNASRAFAQNSRKHLADWINTVIYRQSLKAINYPIVAKSAQGAHFRDSDGNTFVDISMGYGSVFLGHNHPKVAQAMSETLQSGYVLAPQTTLADDVATLICKFTKSERVCFSNTGTEAVMAVVRMVRAKSGRKKIIKFQGSFHGTSDAILNTGDEQRSYPTSKGINPEFAQNVLEFQYGAPSIFKFLEEHHEEIAGVLVEPIQSRRPDFQPKEFLEKLREITQRLGVALIFDETITAFRTARGGISELFEIQPDISTFGKVVGGTMPIGIIAGRKEYLDVIDGGMWEFEDSSYPQEEMMTFGGTFCKHPLTLSASLATLKVLDENPTIQQETNEKTAYLASRLNRFFSAHHYPIKLNHFGSLFRFDFYGEYATSLSPIEIELFFYLLLYKGVYTWEKRVCFLSASHTQKELDFIIDKVQESLNQMRANGFFSKIKSNTMLATSLQKRLFVLSQFEGSEHLYNIYLAWKTPKLDIDRAQKAFEAIVQMHPSLQTNLYLKEESLYQQINSHNFAIKELQAPQDINQSIEAFVHTPFDLEKELLFGVLVIHQESSDILVIKTHHGVFDGPSIDIVMEQFYKLYHNERVDAPQKDYFDFTQHYNNQDQTKQEDFWLKTFSDEIPSLSLPIDKPYPAVRTHRGEVAYFNIEDKSALHDLAKTHHVSLNVLLYASFVLLLHKLTNQEEIIVGMPVTLRQSEHQEVVGMFANTIALPNAIERGEPIKEYLQRTQAQFLEALEYIAYPFEELVEHLELKKDLARNALFDAMFVYEQAGERTHFQNYPIQTRQATFDLTLEIIDEPTHFNCSFKYYSDIFEASTIERFITYFKLLLQNIPHSASIAKLNIIPNAEMLQLQTFNRTTKAHPNQNIVELFEAQVATHPDAIALLCEDRTLSYVELNEQANNLAYRLKHHHHITPNSIIPLLLERSEYMVIAIFGVLKAGGVYLPIERTYLPDERVAFMLEDANAPCVIVDSHNHIKGYEAINIETLAMHHPHNLHLDISPRDLAYVIYTSGSTGKPKGVMIEHASVVNVAFNMANYGYKAHYRAYALTTMNFDMSIIDLILPFLIGMEVVISNTIEPDTILQDIARYKIDVMKTTPSRYGMLLLSPYKANLAQLKLIVSGGEALSRSMLDALQSYVPEVCNQYGPTEATMNSLYTRSFLGESVAIGRPIDNATIYILDKSLEPVALGVQGELCIGGDGLARGYLNQEALTSEKFITHPIFGRLYRSGDVARYLDDGNIEYLGRMDDQVKIRGFRIELGEIESAILAIEGVQQCVVLVYEEALVAYVVAEGVDVKAVLLAKLPSYMVPSHFIYLQEIALNANGKVNKKALPTPDTTTTHDYIAPVTHLQKLLADIFAEVLKIQRISIDESFFDLGGHSIKAIQIVAKLLEHGYSAGLKDIFNYPTIQKLATHLRKNTTAPIVIEPTKKEGYHDITYGQKGLYVLSLMNSSMKAYNETASFRFKGALDIALLQKAFVALIERHEILRTAFVLIESRAKQKIVDAVDFTLDVVESVDYIEQIAKLNQIDFDLANPPLFKITLIKVAPNEHILVGVMHHILSDGWSMQIILRDVEHFYNAYVHNTQPTIEPLSLQYRDFVAYQNALLEQIEYQKNYWLNRFRGDRVTLELPIDFEKEAKFEGNFLRTVWDMEHSKMLRAFALREQQSFFTLLVTLVSTLLYCYSKQEEMVIGTPTSSARKDARFQNQIGYFLNTLAMRIDLSSEASFAQNFTRIAQGIYEDFEHGDYPFDKLMEDLEFSGDEPFFNVMVILQNFEPIEAHFENLSVERLPKLNFGSKFDLKFEFNDSECLELILEYNTARFAPKTIETMLENLQKVMALISKDSTLTPNALEEHLAFESAVSIDASDEIDEDF